MHNLGPLADSPLGGMLQGELVAKGRREQSRKAPVPFDPEGYFGDARGRMEYSGGVRHRKLVEIQAGLRGSL